VYLHLQCTESGKFARHFIARMHAVASLPLLQVCSVLGLLDCMDLPETCSCRPQHILCVSLPQKYRVGMRPAPEDRRHVCLSIPNKRNGFVLAAPEETRAAQTRFDHGHRPGLPQPAIDLETMNNPPLICNPVYAIPDVNVCIVDALTPFLLQRQPARSQGNTQQPDPTENNTRYW